MTTSTTSLALHSLSPKTLALYTPKAASIAISSKFKQDEEVIIGVGKRQEDDYDEDV
ncbi:ribonucleoprotein [Pyrus ussuriensis x Pyrus communis]|uniref:Ribonucleoprotein n=1 Tax=Pyrus ussuriensis x Pyrus communis TaxID=2448454 RepID=A0A5N5FXN0_9ROSA|nr:ribonucleoprotein [Pyrus ussuriensis x Pyrus communis]